MPPWSWNPNPLFKQPGPHTLGGAGSLMVPRSWNPNPLFKQPWPHTLGGAGPLTVPWFWGPSPMYQQPGLHTLDEEDAEWPWPWMEGWPDYSELPDSKGDAEFGSATAAAAAAMLERLGCVVYPVHPKEDSTNTNWNLLAGMVLTPPCCICLYFRPNDKDADFS
jgi:hypothetical protein